MEKQRSRDLDLNPRPGPRGRPAPARSRQPPAAPSCPEIAIPYNLPGQRLRAQREVRAQGLPRELALPVLVLFVHGLNYNLIGQLAARRGLNFGPWLETALDHRVPFLPVFALPYIGAWLFPLAVLVYLFPRRGSQTEVFRRIFVSAILLMAVCAALWIAFPVRVDLRLDQAAMEGYGWLGDLVAWIYRNVSMWNASPSFHVAGPWFLYRAARLYEPRLPAGFLVGFLAIALSTVAIRIHYLADMAAGLLISELVFRLCLVRIERSGALRHLSPPQTAALYAGPLVAGLACYLVLSAL